MHLQKQIYSILQYYLYKETYPAPSPPEKKQGKKAKLECGESWRQFQLLGQYCVIDVVAGVPIFGIVHGVCFLAAKASCAALATQAAATLKTIPAYFMTIFILNAARDAFFLAYAFFLLPMSR